MTESETAWRKTLHWTWLPVVLACGFAARFWLLRCGHGFDFESYQQVIGILAKGGNVYAETTRYNYGPVWFNILHLIDWLTNHDPVIFRRLLVGFLSAVDVGIFWVLWHQFNRRVATWFFLNPLSIIITGYSNQFDNVAILLGLWAMLLLGDDFEKPLNRRKFSGLMLLGVSLMTKHLLFAFPFWLAVKQKGWREKLVVLLVPAAIFLLGFAPYWNAGWKGIIANVFLYRSQTDAFVYNLLVPANFWNSSGPQIFWLLMLVWFAFVCRRKPVLESLLIYTGVLVAFTPAFAMQYLAIPAAFTAVFVNYFSVIYIVIGTCHLANITPLPNCLPFSFLYHVKGNPAQAIYALALGVIWVACRKNLLEAVAKFRKKIHFSPRP